MVILAESSLFTLYLLPIFIFIARIFDVSLGTLRIIFVSRGMRYLAPIVGFLEVLIWLIVIGYVMSNLTNPINYIAYAAGFAAGNFVGIYLENKLALGFRLLRIITGDREKELIQILRKEGYRVTHIRAHDNQGEVEVIYIPLLRKNLEKVISIVKSYDPTAMFTVTDSYFIGEESIPIYDNHSILHYKRLFHFKRKSK